MRLIQASIALILIISSFLVFFYSTIHLETTYSYKAITVQQPSTLPGVQLGKEPSETAAPSLLNMTVYDGLKETVPENAAYWNRLLHFALKAPNKSAPWGRCWETNEELLRTNVHDFSSYPLLLQNFLQGMSCRAPPLLIRPASKCDDVFLLFAIKSSPQNFARRQAVRETWGREGVHQGGLRVRMVFLLGSATLDDPDLTPLLLAEGKHFQDILQWDFHESFLNLTLKMNAFLQWAAKDCPHVTFIFSGDDDVFVNTPKLLGYLQSLVPSKASQLYVGHVIKSASPRREPKSKYYIPNTFYEGPYPPYAGGGGFLYSGKWLQQLHSLSHIIPFFPIDDVFVGMCFKALGATPEMHSGFQTFDVKDDDRENVCVHKNLILVHQRSPNQIKSLWRGIQSRFLTC